MAGGPTREDTWQIGVHVQDLTSSADPKPMVDLGVWDKMSGGESDSNETVYRPGGMAPPISLGGSKTVGNVTVSRLYRLNRDHAHVKRLLTGVGNAKMVVSKQPLDIEGNVFGKPIVWSGRLKRVTTPPVDSETSGAALLELEMTVEGYPSAA